MRRDFHTAAVVVFLVALIALAVVYVIMPNLPSAATRLKLGDGIFHARLALNDEARQKGLSETSSLGADQALLMAFPESDKWSIWMKDMKYAIDIVWLNENKEVVYIVKNADPEGSDKVSFTPRDKSKYVIELPAGTVSGKSIQTGAKAEFQFDESLIQ